MPRPQKHVFVCTQQRPSGHPRGSCAEKGCQEVADQLLQQWQQRALFDKIAVSTAGCLGPCPVGPAVLVYPEGVMYGGVQPKDVTEIVEKHLIGGEPVARLQVAKEIW